MTTCSLNSSGFGVTGSSWDLHSCTVTASDPTDGKVSTVVKCVHASAALIWSPSQIDPEVAAGVHEHFSEDQALELTWDIMRNAANKIMVSLGVDAPLVEEGTELFSVEADGQTVSLAQ